MDTPITTSVAAFDAVPSELKPVGVTRWTARLIDPQTERDYRVYRFADDRRRAMLLMALVSAAGCLNFLIEFNAYTAGTGSFAALIPPFASIWFPVVGLLILLRIKTPGMLEALMVLGAVVGSVVRLSMLTLHPDLSGMWSTLMIGIVFVIYLYMPLRFVASVAVALGFSIAAPLWWYLAQGASLPPDQFPRMLIWLAVSNALGCIAANSLQRSLRIQFAQSLVLQELLSTDAMTGIANRRRFDSVLDRERRRCGRAGAPISLLMIDVDHFKAFNDHNGHPQGDECLRQVARLLVEAAGRPGDLVARYGGEEFVCLLPEIGRAGARAVADKLIAAVRRADIPHPCSPSGRQLTISIGCATALTISGDAMALVASADALLYAAKAAGRDQVMVGQLAGIGNAARAA